MQLSDFHQKLCITIWKWATFHIYQLISSFAWALVEVRPVLFWLCRELSLIIFAVSIPDPKLLVHAKFTERPCDTYLIYITQCRPAPAPPRPPSLQTEFNSAHISREKRGFQTDTSTDLDIFLSCSLKMKSYLASSRPPSASEKNQKPLQDIWSTQNK